jgi:hypothetical protein
MHLNLPSLADEELIALASRGDPRGFELLAKLRQALGDAAGPVLWASCQPAPDHRGASRVRRASSPSKRGVLGRRLGLGFCVDAVAAPGRGLRLVGSYSPARRPTLLGDRSSTGRRGRTAYTPLPHGVILDRVYGPPPSCNHRF